MKLEIPFGLELFVNFKLSSAAVINDTSHEGLVIMTLTSPTCRCLSFHSLSKGKTFVLKVFLKLSVNTSDLLPLIDSISQLLWAFEIWKRVKMQNFGTRRFFISCHVRCHFWLKNVLNDLESRVFWSWISLWAVFSYNETSFLLISHRSSLIAACLFAFLFISVAFLLFGTHNIYLAESLFGCFSDNRK